MDVADLVPAILTTCSGLRRGEVAGEFGAEPRMAKQCGTRALVGGRSVGSLSAFPIGVRLLNRWVTLYSSGRACRPATWGAVKKRAMIRQTYSELAFSFCERCQAPPAVVTQSGDLTVRNVGRSRSIRQHGRFPRGRAEFPDKVVDHVARRTKTPAGTLGCTGWSGRTIERHLSGDP
ncbi:hypothetical protein ACFPOI_60245 [Nonomuraea angiospora]|uniref:Transposase n=1 Tax=Nonomuraea angiospora TaxID=46172 RepID=A0ABR9LQK6_9ACTN|nr:hypothetical protein [Nonomuraea angiospora]MBE1582705.1 hypothetical protein [Nonomuraea angiospora]